MNDDLFINTNQIFFLNVQNLTTSQIHNQIEVRIDSRGYSSLSACIRKLIVIYSPGTGSFIQTTDYLWRLH